VGRLLTGYGEVPPWQRRRGPTAGSWAGGSGRVPDPDEPVGVARVRGMEWR
jgi:hypothetical protein